MFNIFVFIDSQPWWKYTTHCLGQQYFMIMNTPHDQDKNTFLYECQWWTIIIQLMWHSFFGWKCVISIPEKYRKVHNSWCFNYLWKIQTNHLPNWIPDWCISTPNAHWHILEMICYSINIWTKFTSFTTLKKSGWALALTVWENNYSDVKINEKWPHTVVLIHKVRYCNG